MPTSQARTNKAIMKMEFVALQPEINDLQPIQAYEARPRVRGKFLFVADQKLYVKGVTYGAFRPNDEGVEFHDKEKIHRDLAMMAEYGFNVVRIPHTTPSRDFLDIAAAYGLRVMIGISAEQHIGYLIDGKTTHDISEEIRRRVRSVAGHPALLCYGLGNEIPASLARWLGRRKIERYLGRVFDEIKNIDPEGIVTYVNYPTTEYLHLPFLDLVCFNVYLEKQEHFATYLSRLQSLAGDRPLIMSEVGLDSLRNGEEKQAEVLDWQVRTAFDAGCAGAIIFSWTDEWYRGGGDVHDWQFGLTDRDRRPKPSLLRVSRSLRQMPFSSAPCSISVSVVVCTYNGSRTIRECLTHLQSLEYPDYEVIVVNDGSTDGADRIIDEFPFRHIRTHNRGLSAARNLGWKESRGDIVAYIDDDAFPDPNWLDYIVRAFETGDYAAVGGPNLPPEEEMFIATCVARAPGSPTHVMLTDMVAEHIPGCNMAIRRSCLEEIGGFDERFWVAGDDVDICWRLQGKGWVVGLAPAAQVWHHRRPSIRTFWSQQKGYGKAEALLEGKWPERFNHWNHLGWKGRVYTAGLSLLPSLRPVIYHGIWGQAPFQSLYATKLSLLENLTRMPEFHLLNLLLASLTVTGLWWRPLLWFLPLLLASVSAPLIHIVPTLAHTRFGSGAARGFKRWKLLAVTGLLHVIQPVARLHGRITHGLAPWRRPRTAILGFPRRRESAEWTECWIDPHDRLAAVEKELLAQGLRVWRGNGTEAWDLEACTGLLASVRMLMAVEDQGSGTQYVRFASWPRFSRKGCAVIGALAALSIAAGLTGAPAIAFLVIAAATVSLLFRTVREAAWAAGAASAAFKKSVISESKQDRKGQ
jgi:O-antigen biosynthesis protein